MNNVTMLNESVANIAVTVAPDAAAVATGSARRVLWSCMLTWWQRIVRLSRRPPRRLRLCESLPLGERRFVAVVEFEQSRFLVGGTSASLLLLARLDDATGAGPMSRTDDPPEMSDAIRTPGEELR